MLDRWKEAIGGHRKTGVSVTHGTGSCPGTVAAHEYSALAGQLLQSENAENQLWGLQTQSGAMAEPRALPIPWTQPCVASPGHRTGPPKQDLFAEGVVAGAALGTGVKRNKTH